MDYKKAFFSALEESYLGSKIKNQKDKSGFTNLLEIKSQYFQSFKTELEEKIEECGGTDIYNKLYTFFESYLNQTGVPFFNDTPIYKNIYARIYSNSKDTNLFYKTQDLYYVKSDTLYESLEILESSGKYIFSFEVDKHNAQNIDNSKNKIKFYLIKIEDSRIYIQVTYDETSIYQSIFNNEKEFTKEFIKELKENQIDLEEESLKEIFRDYKKQNEIDFFIHKNARAFLQEQFDLWMFNHLYKDSQIHQWELSSIQILQKLRNIAFEIIEKIARFEDELKAIWLKPKFSKNTQYVFSLDLIYSHSKEPQNLIKTLIEDEAFVGQIREWRELELIDESFSSSELLKDEIFMEEKYRYLPIDTKHLSEKSRYALLGSFDDLESLLNGELIKSDNFQALNTLMPKYQGKIDLIYIDPPYNAPASEIIYKNRFKHSTWNTMMENRLTISKKFLTEKGALICAIDENEQENLGFLLNNTFSDYRKTCVSVRHNPKGIQGGFLAQNSEYAYFITPNENISKNKKLEKKEWKYDHLRNWGGESERNTAKNCFYPIYVKNKKIIGFGDVCDDNFHPEVNIFNPDGVIEIYPIDSKGVERKWTYARQSIEDIADKLKVEKNKDGIWQIKKAITEIRFKTIWDDTIYIAGDYGSKVLNNIIPNNNFDYPKSIHLVRDSIYLASESNAVVLDFFAGSGTTAHAVIDLNRDGGNRKFVLVEQGEHFYDVIIPRIKKVSFSKEWKNGKLPLDNKKEKEIQKEPIFIAFRYYELESYEEALRGCEYVLDDERMIDYKKSRKLIKALNKGERICLDMQEPSRKDYDIFQTIANTMGWSIKRIFLDEKNTPSCEFSSGEIINLQEIDLAKYPKLKNLIWWK